MRGRQPSHGDNTFSIASLLDAIHSPVMTLDSQGRIIEFNETCERTLGYLREEVRGQHPCDSLIVPEDREAARAVFLAPSMTTVCRSLESTWVKRDGSRRRIAWSLATMDGEHLVATGLDVTEQRQTEQRRWLGAQLLERLNRPAADLMELIGGIVDLLRGHAGVEAVGLRLSEGEDFPYHVSRGFPPEFLAKEISLCAKDVEGRPVRNAEGLSHLECVCGMIVTGRTDPTFPGFTENGSFWTNSVSELIPSLTPAQRSVTRGQCLAHGYESVALIPLRSGDERIGLLQLNDHRRGCFSPEMIALLERAGASIGVALRRQQTGQLLLKTQEDLEERVRQRTAELTTANARLQEEISRRAQAEEELRQSEERVRKQLAVLDAIFRAAPIGLGVVDHNLCYARVNEQLAAFNGLAASDHVGKSISEVIPHLAGQVEGLYRRVLETGESVFNVEVNGRRGSDPQTEHVWQVSHSPVKQEDGTIVGACAAVQDITERKRAEEALRLSEARLLESQRVGHLGFWEWEFVSGGVDVYWSDETYAIFGYRPGEVVPSTERFYAAVHPDDREFVRQQNESPRQDVKKPQIDYRIIDAAGQVHHVRSRRKVFFRENGVPWRVMGTVQDITDLRRVEESLRIKEAAIASAISGIGITDLEGNLIYVNKAFLDIGGYTEESEVLGRPIVGFAEHPEEAEAVLSVLWSGKSWQGEMAAYRKDGTLADVLISANPVVGPSGKVTCLMVSSIDITARKRAEQALLDNERFRAEAERLAAAGRMAARIAHEINNPLAGIMGCFELVKRAVPANHEYYEYAEMIEREIKRIGDIVHQMYELHRPSDHEVRTVHLTETVREVVTMLRSSIRQHEVGIEDQTAKAGITARLPEGSLRQVLYNLLANAIEASPPGGVVTISAAEIGTQFQILVADQGPGIPLEAQDKLFQPFFTTKDEDSRGGLGLGLPISKGIVDSLQGTIDFESQPGRGTIFRVILPRNASNQESAT